MNILSYENSLFRIPVLVSQKRARDMRGTMLAVGRMALLHNLTPSYRTAQSGDEVA